MIIKDELGETALEFLKSVAEIAKTNLKDDLYIKQRKYWMNAEQGHRQVEYHERTSLNVTEIDILYQKKMHNDFLSQRKLFDLLIAKGIPADRVHYVYILPLVRKWLRSPDPLSFDENAISPLLQDFQTFVNNGIKVSRSRHAIVNLVLKTGPFALDDNVSIRPITEEELWEFGHEEKLPIWSIWDFYGITSNDWNILDITYLYTIPIEPNTYILPTLRESALIAIRIASSGRLFVNDLGIEDNFGLGKSFYGDRRVRQLISSTSPYIVNRKVAERLKTLWMRIPSLMSMKPKPSHLRLPALRLLDGSARERPDDAIVDYTIGLESLLLQGINDELTYRFALRGATILAWEDNKRKEYFKQLKDFYNVRSDIVHGRYVDNSKLEELRLFGDETLRKVWLWYSDRGESLEKANELIDEHILG